MSNSQGPLNWLHEASITHFHASNAFSNIASPSGDFWNTILAMRSSLSSSGKSNQAHVCIKSRLRAVSESPLAKRDEEIGVAELDLDASQRFGGHDKIGATAYANLDKKGT
jgi:hypothetical protein